MTIELNEDYFKKIALGILNLPKFLNADFGINKVVVRLMEKKHKFQEGVVSKKSGLTIQPYSYFATIAKSFLIAELFKYKKLKPTKKITINIDSRLI